MSQIPSTQRTSDFINRYHHPKSCPLREHDKPYLFAIYGWVTPATSSDEPVLANAFHSLDVVTFRDGVQVKDIDLRSFRHIQRQEHTEFELELCDIGNVVTEHDYIVTVVLRYFETK